MFSRSSLEIGDLLGDRFWLSPKKGKSCYVDWCLNWFEWVCMSWKVVVHTENPGQMELNDEFSWWQPEPGSNAKPVHGSCMVWPSLCVLFPIAHTLISSWNGNPFSWEKWTKVQGGLFQIFCPALTAGTCLQHKELLSLMDVCKFYR